MNSSVLHMLPFSPSKIPLYFYSVSLSPLSPFIPPLKTVHPGARAAAIQLSHTRAVFPRHACPWLTAAVPGEGFSSNKWDSLSERSWETTTDDATECFVSESLFFPYFFIIAGSCGMSFYFESHRAGFFLKGEGREWNTCHDPPCLVTVVFVYFCFVVGFYFFLKQFEQYVFCFQCHLNLEGQQRPVFLPLASICIIASSMLATPGISVAKWILKLNVL